MIKQAMILSAGRGSRLKPITNMCPKPLIRLFGKPLIEYHVERLVHMGCRSIVINTGWLGEKIEEYLGSGEKWGVSLLYSREGPSEDDILGTAGGILHAIKNNLLTEDLFFVINSDVWSDFSWGKKFVSFFQKSSYWGHLILVPQPHYQETGDFSLSEDGCVSDLSENPYTFSGMAFYKRIFFETRKHYPHLGDLIRFHLSKRIVSGSVYSGVWSDLGTEERIRLIDSHFSSSFYDKK